MLDFANVLALSIISVNLSLFNTFRCHKNIVKISVCYIQVVFVVYIVNYIGINAIHVYQQTDIYSSKLVLFILFISVYEIVVSIIF